MSNLLDEFFGEDAPISGHGGYRPGAGRKGKAVEDAGAEDYLDFNKARARNEAAKASLNELELQVKSKQYLPRSAYIEATATAIAAFAQTCRTVPDALERKGISPELCEKVMHTLDAALADLASELEKFTETEGFFDD